MDHTTKCELGRKGSGLALVLILVLLALAPTPRAAVAAESQKHVKGAATEAPVPLPRVCGGINPPGAPVPACCMFGYIYHDDAPVSGVTVQVESLQGTRVITTTGGTESTHPYYAVDLSSAPLLVSAGEVITITVSYSGMRSVRTWTVQSEGQHVDLGLVTGYQE